MSKKVLFHLFEEIEKKYLYDTNTNRIFSISEKVYNLLQHYSDETNIKKLCVDNNEIEYLFYEGLLRESKVQIIKHPLSEYLEDILENYVTSIDLQVTQNCNLKCRYCSYSGDGILDRKRNTSKMSLEVALKSIDFLYDHSKKANTICISFYGGEPLLNFSLIKEVVGYVKNKFIGKNIEYKMTTNGTIMNEEILRLLTENNFKLAISLDGPKVIHNRNRRMLNNGVGSYDLVENNLKFIKKRNYKFYKQIVFNCVNELDVSLYNTINYFKSNKLIKMNTVIFNQVDDQKINLSYPITDEYINSKKLFILNTLLDDNNFKKGKIVLDDIKRIEILSNTLNYKNSFGNEFQHAGICIPGLKKMIVDYRGDIRICEKANEISSDAIIGNIYTGFNFFHIKRLLNLGSITKDYCKKCWAMRLCTQCAAQLINIGEMNSCNKQLLCHQSIIDAKEILKEYVILKETRNICQELKK